MKKGTNLRLVAWSFTNTNSFISQLHMECIFVYSGVNSNTRDPHFVSSSDNTDSDFTSVSHKNLIPTAASSSKRTTTTTPSLHVPGNFQSFGFLAREANRLSHRDITLGTSNATSRPPHEQRLPHT